MLNISKICRILLAAAFVCLWNMVPAQAAEGDYSDNPSVIKSNLPSYVVDRNMVNGGVAGNFNGSIGSDGVNQDIDVNEDGSAKQAAPTTGVAVNTTQSAGAVSGCSGDLGLFSGLITTGKTIFEGMRDLIYVVAGFGIIGVAVGGFFGNLNWKWLGAIIIGLVVIATTGELITAITGCTEFTSTMIQDTLK